jgi:hypothetical protein
MATARSQPGKGYCRHKLHGGEQYTGRKAGGTHKWCYDQGEWRARNLEGAHGRAGRDREAGCNSPR